MSDFPFRKYTKKELILEYEKLKNKLKEQKITTSNMKLSKFGLKCSNYFFQYERMKTPSQDKISCYKFWKNNKKKIVKYLENDKQHTNDLFAVIVFLNHAPSQFNPFIAGQIYKHFNAKKVLDPYAGWGDRCLAAMAMDIDYIGIDSNERLKTAYDKMINYYPTKSNIEIIYDKSENVNIDKLDFDFVLTSPPYWNKDNKILEKYNNCELDYNIFLKNSLIPFILNCKKKDKNMWICLNIPKNMYDDIKKYVGKYKKKILFNTNVNNKSSNHGSKKINIIYCF